MAGAQGGGGQAQCVKPPTPFCDSSDKRLTQPSVTVTGGALEAVTGGGGGGPGVEVGAEVGPIAAGSPPTAVG